MSSFVNDICSWQCKESIFVFHGDKTKQLSPTLTVKGTPPFLVTPLAIFYSYVDCNCYQSKLLG